MLKLVIFAILFSVALGSELTRVKAVGYNSNGECGVGSTTTQRVAVGVKLNNGDYDAVKITAGGNNGFFWNKEGDVYGWGDNYYGQVGNVSTTTTDLRTPVLVQAGALKGKKIKLIDSSRHTLAVDSTGQLYSWGYNTDRQLGRTSATTDKTPTAVDKMTGVVSVCTGRYHSCVVNGTDLFCAGQNSFRQAGVPNSNSDVTVFTKVANIKNVVSVKCGYYHTVALTSEKWVFAFGYNTYGQLGNNANANTGTPQNATNMAGKGITYVDAGYYHTICGDGKQVWTTGRNHYGQLGLGNNNDVKQFTVVPGWSNFTSASAGLYYTAAVHGMTQFASWGRNNYYQLDDGTTTSRNSPQNTKTSSNGTAQVQLSTGYYTTYYLDTDVSPASMSVLSSFALVVLILNIAFF